MTIDQSQGSKVGFVLSAPRVYLPGDPNCVVGGDLQVIIGCGQAPAVSSIDKTDPLIGGMSIRTIDMQ